MTSPISPSSHNKSLPELRELPGALVSFGGSQPISTPFISHCHSVPTIADEDFRPFTLAIGTEMLNGKRSFLMKVKLNV